MDFFNSKTIISTFTPSFWRGLFIYKPLILSRSSTFTEWQEVDGQKKKDKKRIAIKDLSIFSIADICKRYMDDGESVRTYSILTTKVNDQMRPILDRMPVGLNPEDENHYLDLEADPTDVQSLLKPTSIELTIE